MYRNIYIDFEYHDFLQILHFFLKFVPKDFTLFDAVVNAVIS